MMSSMEQMEMTSTGPRVAMTPSMDEAATIPLLFTGPPTVKPNRTRSMRGLATITWIIRAIVPDGWLPVWEPEPIAFISLPPQVRAR